MISLEKQQLLKQQQQQQQLQQETLHVERIQHLQFIQQQQQEKKMIKKTNFRHHNTNSQYNTYATLQLLVLSTILYKIILQLPTNVVHAFYHPTIVCSKCIPINSHLYINLFQQQHQQRSLVSFVVVPEERSTVGRKFRLYNSKIDKNDSENNENNDRDKEENESDDSNVEASMDEAFRQLQNLKSIDDTIKSKRKIAEVPKTRTSTVRIDEDIIKEIVKKKSSTQSGITTDDSSNTNNTNDFVEISTSTTKDLSLEKEFASFTKMLDEVEQNEQVELYRDVITELGGSTLLVDTPDTYTDVMLELGGTPKITNNKDNIDDDNQKVVVTKKSIDELVDDAIQQAITDSVTIQENISSSSNIGTTSTTTIPVLFDTDKVVSNIIGENNKDSSTDEDIALRNEIREIIEKGNTKLLENLNTIRFEQEALTNKSIEQLRTTTSSTSKKGKYDNDDEQQTINKERMDTATATIDKMLQIISIETNNIQQATETLTNASQELDNDPLIQLKRGGIIKQLSFIGLLLFSVRSIIDTSTSLVATVSATSTDNVDSLSFDVSQGLIEGVIAIVCAVIYSFL